MSEMRMWTIEDPNGGCTWIIARSEAEALWEFYTHDSHGFDEWAFGDLTIKQVRDFEPIEVQDVAIRTAAEWIAESVPGALCSTWWEL